MKQLIICAVALFTTTQGFSQEFGNHVKTARSSYQAGKLEDAHFALQQALQELDIAIGKEVLKLFPQKMDTMAANVSADNISANVGFVGATVNRNYGTGGTTVLNVISNSPMVAMLNSFLSSPMLAGMSDPNTKMVKIQGYKARLEKTDGGEGRFNYELQVPLGSALISFKVEGSDEKQVLQMANTIPLAQIAKLIQ
ncbi:MAG TPA: hypothetical protein VF145_00095 [Chitinophagaceae bacterium]